MPGIDSFHVERGPSAPNRLQACLGSSQGAPAFIGTAFMVDFGLIAIQPGIHQLQKVCVPLSFTTFRTEHPMNRDVG